MWVEYAILNTSRPSFSPRHDLTLATMTPDQIQPVVQVWIEQFRELGSIESINHVQIFENRGAMMGASNPHPHCQIWATSSIPEAPAKELVAQGTYLRSRGSCLLCDYVALEQRQSARIVCGNDSFIALVPYWAVWPFELLICSACIVLRYGSSYSGKAACSS